MCCKKLIEERKKIWDITKNIEDDLDWRIAVWDEIIETKELFDELMENPWLLIELQFSVVDKNFNLVPFFLNEVQRDFQDNILVPLVKKQEKGEMEQIKIKILKGRQQGFTTYITAFQESLMLAQPNFAGYTMAHDRDATSSIFEDIAKGFLDNLIDEVKEKPKKSNSKELIFDKIKTSWRIGTAGSDGAGRGKKLRMLHNSEKAFWKDIRKMEAAISQALTPKGSIELDETTANGYNVFKDDWDNAVEGKSKWKAVFYAWFRTSEYRKGFKGVDYTEEEFKGAILNGERFNGVDSSFMNHLNRLSIDGLDIEQLHWYFDKRQELKDDVFQEYPSTPEEAFRSSGKPYFDIEQIEIDIHRLKSLKFKTLKGGEIEIFQDPVPGRKYVLGSDVAEGDGGGDNSTFVILDVKTREEVACGEYTQKPDHHGKTLAKWGRIYNNAMIGVERNNHGHSTLNTLLNDEKYKNLFMERTIDKKKNTKKDKLGWLTDSKSKYILLDELDSAHRKGDITINSIKTLKEMKGIQTDDGKVKTNGEDRVMALGIAVQMLKFVKEGKKIRRPRGL